MARYKSGQKRVRVPMRVWMLLLGTILLAIVGIVAARQAYNRGLGPASNNETSQIFTVETGETLKQISSNLEDKKLIKSAWAMQLYVHSKELGDKLQAGTYALAPSQGTSSIVSTLTNGKITTRLVTILPGWRLSQVRADLINSGFSPTEVDKALEPGQYADLPALAFKPASVSSLEGLLWPDSYQKDSSTTPSYIIRESLLEMGRRITPDVQASFASQGLSPYQGITLASVILQEVNKPSDQAQAAQVFLKRLKTGMMMGSDVTARYGSIQAGGSPSNLTYDSPWNTLIHTGLPPTPISTINQSSLDAATHPASTDWLYFVAGDDGTTYFSSTLQEHEALTQKYCHKLCGN